MCCQSWINTFIIGANQICTDTNSLRSYRAAAPVSDFTREGVLTHTLSQGKLTVADVAVVFLVSLQHFTLLLSICLTCFES